VWAADSLGTEKGVTDTASTAWPFLMCAADHAMGLELQIVELVERQARAVIQRRRDDAERIGVEIAQLRAELVDATDYELTRNPIIHLIG
jgi:hypothetical protein